MGKPGLSKSSEVLNATEKYDESLTWISGYSWPRWQKSQEHGGWEQGWGVRTQWEAAKKQDLAVKREGGRRGGRDRQGRCLRKGLYWGGGSGDRRACKKMELRREEDSEWNPREAITDDRRDLVFRNFYDSSVCEAQTGNGLKSINR